MSPGFALTTLITYTVLYVTVLLGHRNGLTARLSPQGYVLLWGFSLSFLIPAICWVAGISAPFNNPDDPLLIGTGGNYGLNYAYFPHALMAYLIPPTVVLLLALLVPPVRMRFKSTLVLVRRLGSQLRIERVAYLGLFFAFIITVWFFTVVGWDRFWYSDLDRFEASSVRQAEFSVKIALTLVLAFGCLGSAMVVFRGLFTVATLTVFTAALPFVAFASRGMTVLVAAYSVGVFFRVQRKRRWLVILPLLLSVYFFLRLPLIMRGSGQTGVLVAAQSLFTTDSIATNLTEAVASSLQNVGQGFGLLVEEREADATGSSIVAGIPASYFYLSVSPSISVLDGFGRNWVAMHPRLNFYTPYSGLCELMAISPWVGMGFPVTWFVIGAWLCRRVSGRSLWHDAGLFAFVLLLVLGFLQLQQYPVRTATRFFYAGFALYGFLQLIAILLQTHAAGKPMAKLLNSFVKPSVTKTLQQDSRLGKHKYQGRFAMETDSQSPTL